jgi:exosortase
LHEAAALRPLFPPAGYFTYTGRAFDQLASPGFLLQNQSDIMNQPSTRHPSPLPAPFLVFIGFCAIACVLMLGSLRPLIDKWLAFDESLGHALVLFLVICAWLWTTRRRFDAAARAPSLRGVALVGLVSLGWTLVALGDIALLEQLALIALFFALAVLVAGWRSMLVAAPPLAMLLFCVPIWDELNSVLLDMSASVVGSFFSVTPITSYVSGNSIILPAGTIIIAGGCSGLRYLIVGLAMANLASATNRLPLKQQLIANAIALGLMVLVNWVRIIVITLVAYFTDMQSSLVADHETFGWILFGFALLPLLLYVRSAPQRKEVSS